MIKNHKMNMNETAFRCGLAALFVFLLSAFVGAAYPVIFVDDAGQTVTIAEKPQRIISLAPSNTEILFAIGAGEQIVGVDEFSNFPMEAQDKVQVGSLLTPSYELIVSLNPDLIVVTDLTGEPGERLRGLGFPVVHVSPTNMEEIYASILLLGRVVDNEPLAEQVVADMKAQVKQVTDKVAGIPVAQRTTVFYEVWHDPLMTAGPGSFMHEIIELAGGINIAADTGTAWPMFSAESLVERDPHVYITPIDETIEDLARGKRPALAGVRAIQDNRVYWIDQDLISRPGPRITIGLADVAAALYPELFQQ